MTNKTSLNPYIAGNPLTSQNDFLGREDILGEVERSLHRPGTNSIVLYGQRRIGKTSILRQLERQLPQSAFVPIYFDLMDYASRPLSRLLYDLSQHIAEKIDFSAPAQDSFNQDPTTFQHIFLPQLYQNLGSNQSLVLLLDEFDVLDTQQQAEPGTAAQDFLPYLRNLLSHEQRLKFVFVVGRRMDDLSADFSATFKASLAMFVSLLSEPTARKLILRAETQGYLRYDPAAVERIMTLTHRHPYLTQLTCQVLFNNVVGAEGDVLPVVQATDVEAAIPDVLEAGRNAFEWIWQGLPPAERIIFAAIAQRTDEGTVLTEADIVQVLQSAGVRIRVRELQLAPQTLVKWGMLDEVDGGYRVYVELLRRWVAAHYPLNRVKDELDRINPLANSLYQGALAYLRQENYERAIAQLQEVQEINPNHLKGRLLLGEIYRQQGALEEAIAEYEAGYALDEQTFRFELVKTLLMQGRLLETARDEALSTVGYAQEAAQNEDAALAIYDQVLQIWAKEPDANRRRVAIWEQRGDKAVEEANYDLAIDAYLQAELPEKLTHARQLKHTQEVNTRFISVTEHENREAWDQATTVYQEIVELEPENEKWQAGLARAKEEQWLAQQYTLLTQYINDKKWAEAERVLAEIMPKRPDYRDTMQLLVQVTKKGESEPDWRLYLPPRHLRRRMTAAALLIFALIILGAIGSARLRTQYVSANYAATVTYLEGTVDTGAAIIATQTQAAKFTSTPPSVTTATPDLIEATITPTPE